MPSTIPHIWLGSSEVMVRFLDVDMKLLYFWTKFGGTLLPEAVRMNGVQKII